MKRTHEIIGLPIISISDGMEVGKVKSIIVNADKGAIDYIVVESSIQILNARVIQTENILGIGEYALTIESEASITEISKIPAAIDLLQKNIQVKGTKVLTRKGRLIGEVGDFYVDEDNRCKITGLEFIADITQKRVRIIPRDSVITFGKNLLVVTEDVESTLLDSASQISSGDRFPEFEKKNIDEAVLKANNVIASEGAEIYKELDFSYLDTNSDEKADPSHDEIPQPEGQEAPIYGGGFPVTEQAADSFFQNSESIAEESSAAGLFEQRQRQYLNGRKSSKTITDNNGDVIISEGMIITDEIIDRAKQSGKLIELVMNNKV
ncbi:MAG: PRC-barrel domain-containing protein [Clostridia bacterium]|nr:PRC-barrel domain-containing protein [Clostridia bacterium]